MTLFRVQTPAQSSDATPEAGEENSFDLGSASSQNTAGLQHFSNNCNHSLLKLENGVDRCFVIFIYPLTLLLEVTPQCERATRNPTFSSCSSDGVDLTTWPQELGHPEMDQSKHCITLATVIDLGMGTSSRPD